MPENVRVQELPGLLKRYKDGVPGWELKETDLDSVIAGRDVVPREELLARVKERSPVYTHKEVVLGGVPQTEQRRAYVPVPGHAGLTQAGVARFNDHQQAPSQLGRGVSHGEPRYPDRSQGGEDYTEILLTQPGARANEYGNHWRNWGVDAAEDAVAHARFDVHDGYLRVNELQSDLGIHNRKQRELQAGSYAGPEEWSLPNADAKTLPFPLEDASLELLLKRLNLYAAQHGLKGVEIASPRAIADKVGGKIVNYEHAYGKVAVGGQQRLGRRLGGMAEEDRLQGSNAYEENLEAMRKAYDEPNAEAIELLRELQDGRVAWKPRGAFDPGVADRFDSLGHAYQSGMRVRNEGERPYALVKSRADQLYATLVEDLVSRGIDPTTASRQGAEAMPRLVRLAEEQAARDFSFGNARRAPHSPPLPKDPNVVYRGTMSDEMRRRIIEQGIGASLLAPLLAPAGDE
jgi:hypothetical protein